MNHHSADDPDDLVRREIDLGHITKMTYQMHVPDSITVGPERTFVPRLHQDGDRLPVRMEVPNSIRLGSGVSMGLANGTNSVNNYSNHSSESTAQQLSLNSSDIEVPSDDEYATIEPPRNHPQHQPIRIADSWHIEPPAPIDDKQVLNNLQTLQNRIHYIERNLARRDLRDRLVYTCLIGYVLLQAFLSVRRSMLN